MLSGLLTVFCCSPIHGPRPCLFTFSHTVFVPFRELLIGRNPAVPDHLESAMQDMNSFLDRSPPQLQPPPSHPSVSTSRKSGPRLGEECTLSYGELQFNTLFPSHAHVTSMPLPLADIAESHSTSHYSTHGRGKHIAIDDCGARHCHLGCIPHLKRVKCVSLCVAVLLVCTNLRTQDMQFATSSSVHLFDTAVSFEKFICC